MIGNPATAARRQASRRVKRPTHKLPPLPTPFHEFLARVLAEMLVEEVRSGKIRPPDRKALGRAGEPA